MLMYLAECWQYCWGRKCCGLASHFTKLCCSGNDALNLLTKPTVGQGASSHMIEITWQVSMSLRARWLTGVLHYLVREKRKLQSWYHSYIGHKSNKAYSNTCSHKMEVWANWGGPVVVWETHDMMCACEDVRFFLLLFMAPEWTLVEPHRFIIGHLSELVEHSHSADRTCCTSSLPSDKLLTVRTKWYSEANWTILHDKLQFLLLLPEQLVQLRHCMCQTN